MDVTPPHFDRLARHYRWLETVTFGRQLQWCRSALLPNVVGRRHALIVGEGDGRFLAVLLRADQGVRVDCLDVSPAMAARAATRAAAVPGGRERVRFVTGDVRTTPFPAADYDLIVTNFLLDCFPADELAVVVGRLAAVCRPGGVWLVGDFRRPAGAWSRRLADVALWGMYRFFRVATRLPARELVDPDPLLAARGFVRVAEACRLRGFLAARLWRAAA